MSLGCRGGQRLEGPIPPDDLLQDLDSSLVFKTTPLNEEQAAQQLQYANQIQALNANLAKEREPRRDGKHSNPAEVLIVAIPAINSSLERTSRLLADEKRMDSPFHSVWIPNAFNSMSSNGITKSKFEIAKFAERWGKAVIASRPGFQELEFGLTLRSIADNFAQESARKSKPGNPSEQVTYLSFLSDETELAQATVEAAKRELRDVAIPSIAAYDTNRLKSGADISKLTSAEQAMVGHPFPLDKHATVRLLSQLVATSLRTLSTGALPGPVSTSDVIDWPPAFLGHGDFTPSEDEEEAAKSNLVSTVLVAETRDRLSKLTNPYGRYLAYRLAKNLIPTTYLRHRQSSRIATRVMLAIAVYRQRHAGQWPPDLETLRSERILPELPSSLFCNSLFIYNASQQRFFCTPSGLPPDDNLNFYTWQLGEVRVGTRGAYEAGPRMVIKNLAP